ncbi:MAG: EpsG family protein [Proteobacteria bacterium]|nr:EpsG family protein [Pseudomonadota bacterium]
MILYWLLYLYPVILVLLPLKGSRNVKYLAYIVAWLGFSFAIGLRWEVGADWGNYLPILDAARDVAFTEALSVSDPGYMAINWLSIKLGYDIVGVNLVCGAIFVYGLIQFSKKQPLPWLAFSIAIPYLLIVVAMGYTRQGAALGFVFLALNRLQEKKSYTFIFFILLGALFHKSAVAILPLYALCSDRKGNFRILLSLVLILPIGVALVYETFSAQWTQYIEEQMQSDGAAIRITMNLIPAILFFMFRNKWYKTWPDNYQISKWLSIAACLCVLLLQVASTATDRLALYVAPLQLMLFSRLPFMVKGGMRGALLISTIVYYGIILFVWLNFSFYAQSYWVPYKWPGFE